MCVCVCVCNHGINTKEGFIVHKIYIRNILQSISYYKYTLFNDSLNKMIPFSTTGIFIYFIHNILFYCKKNCLYICIFSDIILSIYYLYIHTNEYIMYLS